MGNPELCDPTDTCWPTVGRLSADTLPTHRYLYGFGSPFITRTERHRVLKWALFVFRIFIFIFIIFFRVDFRSFADCDMFEFFYFFHALFYNGGFDCRPS